MIQSKLIDNRNVSEELPSILDRLAKTDLWGFDIETQDEARHSGLNLYNNGTRHVFDHRRTTITGFSIYIDGDDTAYYFNMAQADVENRLPDGFWKIIFETANPEAIVVAHNATFELCMVRQCWGLEDIPEIVCTMQMAVSHHGPDEYDIPVFYQTPLPAAFDKIAAEAVVAFSQFSQGDSLSDDQQELLGKFIAKESKAVHSWNGYVKSIAKGYNLKQLTKSKFGYVQKTYEQVLSENGAKHMGQLTGEQVCAYGADDSYWAVQHYKWMLDDMLKNNPAALVAFFEQENPMVHLYADAWRQGIRLDLEQVFDRREVERAEMAATLRRFKANIRKVLPFNSAPNQKLLEREAWYEKGYASKRKQIEAWAKSPDKDDDFEQCFQVSNPIGNAWAGEKGIVVPKGGKLNLVYYMGMRTIMYDLLELPIQYSQGSIASDSDARGKIREKLDKMEGPDIQIKKDIMKDLQEMAEIEQRMKLYLTPYTQLMDPETSCVYPVLSSILATRRLATSFPNPMQLAKRGNSAYIRGFYLGDSDDHIVVSADWSAIELVIIGDQSGDPGFRKVYGQIPYGDMHSGAAVDGLSVKTLPGLTEEEFREFKFGRNPNNRRLVDFSGSELSPSEYYKWSRGTPVGKGINFSYWYSGALSTVATNLGWTDKEHWEAVDKYRARFPLAEAWRVQQQDIAAMQGYLTLPDGHRRNRFEVTNEWRMAMKQKFADISPSHGMLAYGDLAIKRLQGRARNQVVNAAIQGTCATLAKRSLLRLRELCLEAGIVWGVDVRLMMPIHDELVFSVHKDLVMTFIPMLREAMTTHPDIVKTLPLHCTVAIGRTFRPFNKKDPKFTQIELDEAQVIEGVIEKELEGKPLSDNKIRELLEYMYS